MNYIGRLFSGARDYYYKLNTANSTGAIDVIVIRQPDGTHKSTAFHVRFGKMGVLLPRAHKVELYVNGQLIKDIHMRIGPTGHAYFEPTIESEKKAFQCRRASITGSSGTERQESEAIEHQPLVMNVKCVSNQVQQATLSDVVVGDRNGSFQNVGGNVCHQEELHTIHSNSKSTAPNSSEQSKADTMMRTAPTHITNSANEEAAPSTQHFDGLSTRYQGKEPCPSKPRECPASQSALFQMPHSHRQSITANEGRLTRSNGKTNLNESPMISKQDSEDMRVQLKQPQNSAQKVDDSCCEKEEIENICRVTPLMSPVHLPIWDSYFAQSEDEENSAEEFDPRSTNDPDAQTTKLATTSIEGAGYLSDEDNRSRIPVGTRSRRTSRCLQGSCLMTPKQLATLNLRRGVNEAVFSVVTRFQGTCQCASYIYLWNWDEKIVISDIDGTITKSDWLGHLMPLVGCQWIHPNVARVYYRIAQNGYRFLYLSSRAIGQSKATRGFLNTVQEGGYPLPDGPILLAPFSMITAFQKEVIQKKADEFKIDCLRQVRDLFPPVENEIHETSSAFVAGFGNRPSDVLTYRAVGLNDSQIFTVNHRSEIMCGTSCPTNDSDLFGAISHSKVQMTFESLLEKVNVYFPCTYERLPYASEHSDFTHWQT